MRKISIRYPSGKPSLWLWEGTEDEQSFPILGVKSNRPYVRAYGKKYELTDEEIKALWQLKRLAE